MTCHAQYSVHATNYSNKWKLTEQKKKKKYDELYINYNFVVNKRNYVMKFETS